LQAVKTDSIQFIVKQHFPFASYLFGTNRAMLSIPIYHLTNQLHKSRIFSCRVITLFTPGYFSRCGQANISLSTLHGGLIMFHVTRAAYKLLMLMSYYLAG